VFVKPETVVRWHRGRDDSDHTATADWRRSSRSAAERLQDVGAIEASAVEPTDAAHPLISGFCQWMRQQRGTCTSTLSIYEAHIREILARLGDETGTWKAQSLRQFVLEASRTRGWATAKKRTTVLRMLLRFLIADGRCASGLTGAVPVLAHWRLSSLPRYLSPDDVERVIASCDVAAAVGQRDRAILLLLARLGLRAGDIVQMQLHDIDWKGGWIHVTGKGRRETRLPLTREVGDALVAYPRGDRPRAPRGARRTRAQLPSRRDIRRRARAGCGSRPHPVRPFRDRRDAGQLAAAAPRGQSRRVRLT
jgi:integrase